MVPGRQVGRPGQDREEKLAPRSQVVRGDHLEQGGMAAAPLFERHRERMGNRCCHRLRVVGIHQQRRAQFGGRPGEARQDQDAGILGILLGWEVRSPAALAAVLLAAGWGVSVVSTFLSALVARAGQKNVLFVLVCFPLLVPLLLSAISATLAAAEGGLDATALRVILAYDGAATCAAYLLAAAAWEE